MAAPVEAVKAGESPAGRKKGLVAVAKMPPVQKERNGWCTEREREMKGRQIFRSLPDHVGGVARLVEVLRHQPESGGEGGGVLDAKRVVLRSIV